LLAFVFVCLLTGVGSYFLIERPAPLPTLSSVFPKETLSVVEWNNAGQAWARWRKSFLLNSKARARILKFLGVPEPVQTFEEVDKLAGLYDAIATDPIVHALFNARAALAVLPELDAQASQPFSLTRQWVLALQTDTPFSLQHHSDLAKLFKLDTISVFQGETITHFTLPRGEKLAYWQQPGVVLFANEERLLQRCIQQHFQRMIRQHASLDDNPIWQRMKEQGGGDANVFGYADLERLRLRLPWLQEFMDKAGTLQPRYMALYQHFGEQTDRVGGLALVDSAVISAVAGNNQLPPPQGPLPANPTDATVLLLWTNWLNLKEAWSHVVQQANEETAAFLATVEQAVADGMGGTIDSFFDVFGQRIGVFINDQGAPDQANRSLGCLAIELRDRGQVERLIKQLIAGLQVITVQTGATEIHTVMLAGGLLQPAYSLENNRLLLADNIELIEQARHYFALDEQGGASQQSMNPDNQGNFFLFVRPTTVVERILPVLTAAAKEHGERNRFFAPENRLKLRETILPLLSGLQDMKALSLRCSVTVDSIAVDVTYALDAR
jgi:hypothetical protein